MSMKYMTMMLGPIMTNCYIVYDSETKDAMVIDPAWDYEKIDQALGDHQLKLQLIFLTHGHADHIGALQELRNYKHVPVYIGEGDVDLISNSRNNLSAFMGKPIECTSPDHIVHDGETLQLGNLTFTILETPGHTPGGLSLYGGGVVFSGDTLFRYSVGRTDLYGGSTATLIDSIHRKLMTLPDDTVVLPGHGPATQIGEERRNNPYLDGGW
ncbi:beta-lactamase [Megasphaera cerevisiae DSM 20462]|jgi:glyoxylase-like metal-dependent hydrolase (beta-lactamase superfamily II)|uniref:Beta-lactamase n=1 Tax=Megasphaera cerevisiae DSM 20462 TaxID=1122219 RepID=A0A0J6WW43_9FIRM|nr:MBL fold metallo-hydrolase [Megasphaera cerevisiae]KMO86002.1 beta-lactamase [Megasphaera cerevisiae DSM 20462]MCI1750638.1 MBL fold metallo-hydrolase [Megasphaera cerevisiae]OKY54424.1 MBL fold metallo-hydrolase [Megasphaera cerevisiae]SJZ73735.1 Glyoxylase, beta-lactamase superfamily II [Megasphaera cerevisiae DSM 20462]